MARTSTQMEVTNPPSQPTRHPNMNLQLTKPPNQPTSPPNMNIQAMSPLNLLTNLQHTRNPHTKLLTNRNPEGMKQPPHTLAFILVQLTTSVAKDTVTLIDIACAQTTGGALLHQGLRRENLLLLDAIQ